MTDNYQIKITISHHNFLYESSLCFNYDPDCANAIKHKFAHTRKFVVHKITMEIWSVLKFLCAYGGSFSPHFHQLCVGDVRI
jgi:hypothetical protein